MSPLAAQPGVHQEQEMWSQDNNNNNYDDTKYYTYIASSKDL